MLRTVPAFDRIGEENAFAVLARANALAAQGRDVINLGDRYELALRACDTDFVLEVSKRHRVRAGELVLLAVDPARIRVWSI